MLTGLDHIIIGVNDLGRATKVFSQDLGLAVSGGGIHPVGGTANRIIVIGDTYLELIAVRNRAEAQQSMLDRLAKGDGYLNFVLASNDILEDSEAMLERGIAIIGPQAGELKSADGRRRSWIRSDVERGDLTQRYPFLIQHDSQGLERRMRLAGWRTPPPHPLGATRVLNTTIVVADLAEASARFQHIYALEPSVQDPSTSSRFALGHSEQSFELVAPPAARSNLNEDWYRPLIGGLRQHLQTFGESLCCITLVVEDVSASQEYLDTQEVAYIYQEDPQRVLWINPNHTCGAAITLCERA